MQTEKEQRHGDGGDLEELLSQCDALLRSTRSQLQNASYLVSRVGLTIESPIISTTAASSSSSQQPNQSSAAAEATTAFDVETTIGYSNTDHIIQQTDDPDSDFVNELKRRMIRRHRSMQPESRSDSKWDKNKIAGSRRRRIVRDDQADEHAPKKPLQTGHSVFVAQMTAKWRHDHQDKPHNQAILMKEIAKRWNSADVDREYYNTFAKEATEEYEEQRVQYRATGKYEPSTRFRKLDGGNVWVRKADDPSELIELEREISSYETVYFPPRPPSLDEEYAAREKRSLFRRKLKMKGLLSETDPNMLKDGRTLEEAFVEAEQEGRTDTAADTKKKPVHWRNKPRKKRLKIEETTTVVPTDRNNSRDDADNEDGGGTSNNGEGHGGGDDDGDEPVEENKPRVLSRKPRDYVTSKLVYCGPPTEPLWKGFVWPPGWEVRVSERRAKVVSIRKGNHEQQWKMKTERYFYTPIHRYRLRSPGQVEKFLEALKESNGDEAEARDIAGISRRT